MTWTEMTPEERNRLVAEKVMGWQPKPCDDDDTMLYDAGEMCCRNCGVYEHINSFEHGEPLPPRYTQSMDAAWPIFQAMVQSEQYSHAFRQALVAVLGLKVKEPATFSLAWIARLTPEKICKAALESCGVHIA